MLECDVCNKEVEDSNVCTRCTNPNQIICLDCCKLINTQNTCYMAYNGNNKMKLIIRIQKITLEHTAKGITQEWIFNNLIKETYCISRTTYYRYLATRPQKATKK